MKRFKHCFIERCVLQERRNCQTKFSFNSYDIIIIARQIIHGCVVIKNKIRNILEYLLFYKLFVINLIFETKKKRCFYINGFIFL